MHTVFLLMAQYNSATVKLSDICATYFGMSVQAANRMASLNKLPIASFRLGNSQKSPRLVHLQDLADYIDKKREEANRQWQRSNSF